MSVQDEVIEDAPTSHVRMIALVAAISAILAGGLVLLFISIGLFSSSNDAPRAEDVEGGPGGLEVGGPAPIAPIELQSDIIIEFELIAENEDDWDNKLADLIAQVEVLPSVDLVVYSPAPAIHGIAPDAPTLSLGSSRIFVTILEDEQRGAVAERIREMPGVLDVEIVE